ncbi:MAG: hypothetical protein L0Z51_00255 [Candidatus Latescibacteria bacterium]|nr:hypothetical protein [Candidatus Latescibacterota bacterium]
MALLLALAFVLACEDDPAAPQSNTSAYQALTTREAVLNNLEVGWTQRNAGKIDELLDDNFTFYFSPRDVDGGLPPSWDRASELTATAGLMTSNTSPTPRGPVCTSVHVDLDNDEVIWTELPGPATAFGEVSYSTTVFYRFTFEMEPDMTFIAPPGAQAQFVVRQIEGGEWRLVEWYDLGNDAISAASSAASQEKPWGSIKYLYSGKPKDEGSASGTTTWGGVKVLYRD